MPPRTIQAEQTPEINRGYLDHIRAWSGTGARSRWKTLKDRVLFGNQLRVLLLPLLFLAGKILTLSLRLSARWHTSSAASALHQRALTYVDALLEQYPLNMYPLVAKALELAYLSETIRSRCCEERKILEVAIGEGGFSTRLFTDGRRVTGIDLNPYSLAKAVRSPHVNQAIVGDGLKPPVRHGTFDLLLAVNFLHHVTQKESTVANWSHLARRLLFTENTPFWASGWTIPYLLRKVGAKETASSVARRIAKRLLQNLEAVSALDKLVAASCDIEDRMTFMSERTFFYCSLSPFLMRCYGAPTPALLKRWFLGALRPFVLPMTKRLAQLLIVFDAYQDRSTDTFVVLLARSRRFRANPNELDLLCARCRNPLNVEDQCEACGIRFPRKDGMLFLLPNDLRHIEEEYRSDVAATLPSEHL